MESVRVEPSGGERLMYTFKLSPGTSDIAVRTFQPPMHGRTWYATQRGTQIGVSGFSGIARSRASKTCTSKSPF